MLKAALAGATAVALPFLVVVLVAGSQTAEAENDAGLGSAPSALATKDIPPHYLRWYMDAAQTCAGLPWAVLAAVGKVESDHGRSNLAGVSSGANSHGARGPMQFLPSTFAAYAVDGDRDGTTDIYNPADAIYAAAAMLCANGARDGTDKGIRAAIFAYNHSAAYVTTVLDWATRYTASPAPNKVVAKAIAFAKAQLGKPYCWGGEGPDCFDCSGLLYTAYAHAGVHIGRTTYQWRQTGPQVPISQIQPGDLVFSAGADGTPTNPGHVVMYLGANQVIQAPQTGDVVKISPLDRADIVIATRPAALAQQQP